jgi:hypothetical protein
VPCWRVGFRSGSEVTGNFSQIAQLDIVLALRFRNRIVEAPRAASVSYKERSPSRSDCPIADRSKVVEQSNKTDLLIKHSFAGQFGLIYLSQLKQLFGGTSERRAHRYESFELWYSDGAPSSAPGMVTARSLLCVFGKHA